MSHDGEQQSKQRGAMILYLDIVKVNELRELIKPKKISKKLDDLMANRGAA